MIGILWQVMMKNFRLIYRTKTSALVILLGPLFIIGIVGAAFSTSGLHSITISIYSPEPSEVVEDIVSRLGAKDFTVSRVNALDECVGAVKRSESHVCIEFPGNFDPGNKTSEINFYLDYSRINLAMVIWDALSQKVSKKSAEISAGFVEGMLTALKNAEGEIQSSRSTVDSLSSNSVELNASIGKMLLQLESMNESGFDAQAAKFSIASAEKEVNAMDIQLKDFKVLINNASATIESGKKDGLSAIEITSENLEANKATFEDLLGYLEVVNKSVCSGSGVPECSRVEDSIGTIEAELGELSDAQIQLNESKSLIEGIGTEELDSVNSEIEDTSLLVNETKTTIASMKESVESADAAQKSFESTRKNASAEGKRLQKVVQEGVKQMEGISAAMDNMSASIGKISSVESESILRPIKTVLKPVTAEKGSFDFLFPSLLTLVIMFGSILLASTSVLTERESKAYFRNLIVPVRSYIFVLGTLLSNITIMMLQAIVLLVIAKFVFDIEVFANIPGLVVSLVLVSAVFVLAGMIIGFVFNSEETATIASVCLSMVLFLFSSVIMPIEKMTKELAAVAKISPFVLSEGIFRHIIIFESSLVSAVGKVLGLLAFIAILTSLVLYAQRGARKRV